MLSFRIVSAFTRCSFESKFIYMYNRNHYSIRIVYITFCMVSFGFFIKIKYFITLAWLPLFLVWSFHFQHFVYIYIKDSISIILAFLSSQCVFYSFFVSLSLSSILKFHFFCWFSFRWVYNEVRKVARNKYCIL